MPKVRREAKRGGRKAGVLDVLDVQANAPRLTAVFRKAATKAGTLPLGTKVWYIAHRQPLMGDGAQAIYSGFYATYNAAVRAKAKLERLGGGAGGRGIGMYEIGWRRVIG